MRIVDRSGGKPLRDLDDAMLASLSEWLVNSRLRSEAARQAIERQCMDDLRMYQGVSSTAERNVPIDQAPNLEITLGAVAVDGIYANFVELVTQASQLVTIIPRKHYEDYADALQDLVDWGCREAFNVEEAINVGPFDCIRIGTMDYYIPYSEKVRVTDIAKTIDRGPRIVPIAFEDFHLPEGSQGNIQYDPWCEMDLWLYPSELRLMARAGKWAYYDPELKNVTRAASIPELTQRRYDLARDQSSQAAEGTLYQLVYRCGEYDIDDDGINEELEIIWDKTSGHVLDVKYPNYQVRPFEHAVYQIQPKVAWGLSVQRMCAPYEEEVTVIHNERVLNMRLANARIWKATQQVAPFMERIWPGKVIRVSRTDEFTGEKMADVYPSSAQAELMDITYAERRTGLADLTNAGQKIGTRTPGISALSYMQAAYRRFTPPFRNMRNCLGAAVRQCLYRYQERVRAKDKHAIDDLLNVLGEEKGNKVIELFQKVDNLIDAFDAQITATSVSVNREADRQNWLMYANFWTGFQKQRLELEQFAANAPTPHLKQVAEEIIAAGLYLLRRFTRTFEQVSDVDRYLAEVRGFEEMAGQLPPQFQQGLQGLAAQLGGAMAPQSQYGPQIQQAMDGQGPPPEPSQPPPPQQEAA